MKNVNNVLFRAEPAVRKKQELSQHVRIRLLQLRIAIGFMALTFYAVWFESNSGENRERKKLHRSVIGCLRVKNQ